MSRYLFCAFLCFGFTTLAQAQDSRVDPEFSSDRPGYSNATEVAPVGRVVLQFGATATYDEDDPETLGAPDAVIRYGILGPVELRIGVPSITGVLVPDAENRVVTGPFSLGTKIALGVHGPFSSSFIAALAIGLGGDGLAGRFEWNWQLAFGMASLFGNFAATYDGSAAGDASVGVSISPSAVFSVYAQAFMLWAFNEDPEPFVGAGLAFQVAPRFLLDAFADVGLLQQSTRLTMGVGLTVLVGSGEDETGTDSASSRSSQLAQLSPQGPTQ